MQRVQQTEPFRPNVQIPTGQRVNEVTEETSASEEECNLIRCFDSCDDFEIMIIDKDKMSKRQIEDYISDRINRKCKNM